VTQIETPQFYLGPSDFKLFKVPPMTFTKKISSVAQHLNPRAPLARTGESSSNPQPPTMSDSDPLSINCWLLGDDYKHVFQVEIPRNKVVGHLKDAIKVKNHVSLNDIDAHTLILYKVSIECTPQLAEHVAALKLNENEELLPWDELSEVFANGLPRKHLHVVVETPSGAWVYVGLSSLR
jgi:hypothetical protein